MGASRKWERHNIKSEYTTKSNVNARRPAYSVWSPHILGGSGGADSVFILDTVIAVIYVARLYVASVRILDFILQALEHELPYHSNVMLSSKLPASGPGRGVSVQVFKSLRPKRVERRRKALRHRIHERPHTHEAHALPIATE